MAAPMKRNVADFLDDYGDGDKRVKLDHEGTKLNHFINWARKNNFLLTDKVTIGREKSCAQYGMIAVEDINEGELLFQIPRTALLTPDTCAIRDFLQKEKDSVKGTSGWAPLLISLMHEYNNPNSLWRPYLDLVPDFSELDLPMFWPSKERAKLLKGSGVTEAVDKDLVNIEEEFNTSVLPFVKKYEDKFSPVCKDLEFYKKMVAFVMAYSFTEHAPQEEEVDEDSGSPPPVMVPMADILNHVAKNNAHLNFEKEAFKMVATENIKKGEEVYNTYGELANWHLLHMYGFAEAYPDNHWDTVEIYSTDVMEAAKSLEVNTDKVWTRKKDYLESEGMYGNDVGIILGVDGILNEEETTLLLKVCCMAQSELDKRLDGDDWESDEDDEDEDSLSLTADSLAKMDTDWKKILKRCAELSLQRYDSSIADDEKTLKSGELSTRQRYAKNTVYGQKQLLQKLIEKCR